MIDMTTTAAPRAWHADSPDDAIRRLSGSRNGLSSEEAARRRVEYGPNDLTPPRRRSGWTVLARQFTSPLIYALLASAGVAYGFGEVADGSVVLGVVVLNAAIGFGQEYRAGRAIQALAALVSDLAVVQRDGRWAPRPAEDLVPGDVLTVEAGDRMPADLRVLDAHGLLADESALTGESLPVAKSAVAVDEETSLADRTSLLHAGTLAVAGTAQALVVRTGAATELGRISAQLDAAEETETPLTRDLRRLGSTITRAVAVVAAVLLGVALVRGYPVADAALAAISLAVAAIPEGLPAIVTIALAVGVQRMARRRAVVRQLPAVETLGATSVVCTDKTGTLTRNEMMLRRAWCPDGAEAEFEGTGYAPGGGMVAAGGGTAVGPAAEQSLRRLLAAAVVANEARLSGTGPGRTVLGDPTDGALLVGAERGGLPPAAPAAPRAVLPFDPQRRYMAVATAADPPTTYFKGAPEALLPHGGTAAAAAYRVLDRFAALGLRVLAITERPGDDVDAPPGARGALRLLGLVALVDPPRSGAAAAVHACHAAGVQVKMITGDHPATAAAIGRELGISGSAPAMTGAQIAGSSDAELRERVRGTEVFARVAPEHKLRLVRALQDGGAVTAMTGDGVNDAPALRQADVGVAMGRAGTAVAKEAADIVLVDDEFSTLRAAIEEGRRVYDNLVKALLFALPTNVGEGLIILVAVLTFPLEAGRPVLPIEPVQILWINLVATVALALPLALESAEPGVMRRPPRPAAEPLLTPFVVLRTAYVGVLMSAVAIVLFLAAAPLGVVGADSTAQTQTLAVTAVAFFQICYLFACRTFIAPVRTIGWRSNPAVFAGVALLLVLHVGFVHLPAAQALFGTASLTPAQWALAATAGAVVLPAVAVEKRWRRRVVPTPAVSHVDPPSSPRPDTTVA
ncbi:MAG TPA: HAD-IC family P-type ATPase [Pilimelia sp.]|nr:HAD-IC family P-type ATPase [Pilimelia sp.]